ncbi:SHOCT domain-containing protein [Knoellia sp. 3-2P3]|uniref:SHOCT domain-containing protein n=1 Tax=unclassified Knoellia TaxID=2618719 RepID=UPI0023DC7576|nr:SHOCT domain-containing protein [Knoellia sp. 3-2P3]MDF2091729.1 SHOCT domain-containing protein [Knoellia sp. 3-2P3]
MPGLLRGVARTAVVAGTATAVSGRVQRRQAEKYATRDANIYAQREQAYADQQAAAAPPPPAPAAAPASSGDTIAQLKELAELKTQGILTEEEFAAQKAKLLGA